MWFEQRRKPAVETEPVENYHLTPEAMIARGDEIATFKDLEGLDYDALLDLARICPVDTVDADSCVPCRAYAMAMDIEKTGAEEAEEYQPTPRLDATMAGEDPWAVRDDAPVVDRFVHQVNTLNDLVQELLMGPPIPPPGVTLDELATLVVATQKWIRMTEAGGADLSDNQQAVLNATKALVQRLHRGDAQ